MNGFAIGPVLIVIAALVALLLFVGFLARGGRRRGGIVVAALLVLLVGLAFIGALLPRAAYTRAVEERARAEAAQEQALRAAELLAKQLGAGSEPYAMLPALPEEPDSETDADFSDADEEYRVDAGVESLKNEVEAPADHLRTEIEATTNAAHGSRNIHVQTHRPASPPKPPKIGKKGGSSRIPERSLRAQIVTGIMLAGVVLASYFFLNANTRGHYTWRLRIGSTLVFIASLVVILLVCEGC